MADHFLAFGITLPVIFKTSLPLVVLVVSVMDLSCFFVFPAVLNFAMILEDAPGLMGCLGQVGTVQPQDGVALVIIRSVSPALVTVNSAFTTSPSLTVQKSKVS